jgi:hypothetical protein
LKKRHVLAVLGLSFVTLGIYVIYWLYKTRQELLSFLPDKKAIPMVTVLFIPIFVMIASFIGMAMISVSTTFMYSGSRGSAELYSTISIIVTMLSILAVFVVAFWWFYRYFKAVEAVTQGNDAMLLYTLWIILTIIGLGPVWVLIVQNDLNKFIENGNRPLKAPVYPGYPDSTQQWQTPTQPQYGQPYPSAPNYPNQAPAPGYQQPYPQQYPQQAQEHHPHHEGQHHAHHDQHQPHHSQHHGHPDQPHNDDHGDNGQQQQPPQYQV